MEMPEKRVCVGKSEVGVGKKRKIYVAIHPGSRADLEARNVWLPWADLLFCFLVKHSDYFMPGQASIDHVHEAAAYRYVQKARQGRREAPLLCLSFPFLRARQRLDSS